MTVLTHNITAVMFSVMSGQSNQSLTFVETLTVQYVNERITLNEQALYSTRSPFTERYYYRDVMYKGYSQRVIYKKNRVHQKSHPFNRHYYPTHNDHPSAFGTS